MTTYNRPPVGHPQNPDTNDPAWQLITRVLDRVAPMINGTHQHMWTGGNCNYPGIGGPNGDESTRREETWQMLVSCPEAGRAGVTTDDGYEILPTDKLMVGITCWCEQCDGDFGDDGYEMCAQHDEALAAAVLAVHARFAAAHVGQVI